MKTQTHSTASKSNEAGAAALILAAGAAVLVLLLYYALYLAASGWPVVQVPGEAPVPVKGVETFAAQPVQAAEAPAGEGHQHCNPGADCHRTRCLYAPIPSEMGKAPADQITRYCLGLARAEAYGSEGLAGESVSGAMIAAAPQSKILRKLWPTRLRLDRK